MSRHRTEAAAVAALYVQLLAGLFYRPLTLWALYRLFVKSARSSAAVGVVTGGALILNFIVVSKDIPGMIPLRDIIDLPRPGIRSAERHAPAKDRRGRSP